MRRLCVAYRQLCAVTFAAIGLLCAACSGGPGGAVASSNKDRAPSNADQPPSNAADQAPSNSDQAPTTSTDAPPSNPDAPAGNGGGSLGALCREFCESLQGFSDRCGGGAEGDLCDASDCQVPAGYPCGPETAEVFQCLIDNLDNLCTDTGRGNGDVPGNGAQPQPQDPVSICQTALDKANACSKAHGLDDGGDTTQQHGCYQQGGCECADPCQTCTCKANGKTGKITACYMGTGACAQTP
jgi:hypothetical protein